MTDDGVNLRRRRMLTVATSVVGAAGVVGAAVPFIGSWNPSAKARAAGAPVEVNIAKIEPGQMITVEWRGKPVYILRRTPEALALLETIEDDLRDPMSEKSVQPDYVKNRTRAMQGKENICVLLGVCTHLGCAPSFKPNVGDEELGDEWVGGFLCNCHGSRFDLAGRVFAGVPAPINLEIPPYKYLSDNVIVVGVGQEEQS